MTEAPVSNAAQAFFDNVCSPFVFGPIQSGFLSLCFVDLILWTIQFVWIIVFGIWRLNFLRKRPRDYRPISKTHVIEVTISALLAIAPVVDLLYYFFTKELPYFKVFNDCVTTIGWFIALVVIIMEYLRGYKHNWVIISFWVYGFVLQGVRVNILVEEGLRNFASISGIIILTVLTLLALLALLFNKLPKSINEKDEEENQDEFQRLLFDREEDSYGGMEKAVHEVEKEEADLKSKQRSPEERANIFSKATFWWMNPLLKLGYIRALKQNDLPKLMRASYAELNSLKLEKTWRAELEKNEPSYTRALIKGFWFKFFLAGFYKFGNDAFTFVGPILLEQLVLFVSPTSDLPFWVGLLFAIGIFLGSILQSLCVHLYFHMVYKVGMNIRNAVIGTVYRKAFRMSHRQRQTSTVGEIVNLQSIDAQRICDTMTYLHMIWSAPIQIIVSLVLLWRVVGPSALGGLGVMILLLPLQLKIGKSLAVIQKDMMKRKDARNKIINEVLQGIRVIKFFAWELSFTEKIKAIRALELKTLRKSAFLRAGMFLIWTFTPLLVSMVTFAIYVLVGNTLTADKAFPAIALFNIMRFPLNVLPMVITSLVECFVSIKRISKFMLGQELDDNSVSPGNDDGVAIKVTNGTFEWLEDTTVLEDINITVKKGSLLGVVGQVGAGKSTLLSSLLGEIPKTSGQVNVNGSIAYVPQQAWIQNATVKDNILFCEDYDEDKYLEAIGVTELGPDLKILPAGDNTEIGEKGINLSGGQKQRVSLARSVYQAADIYLMDDPLSAVDAHVARAIFDNCINGALAGTTRVLVTHQLQYLDQCDQIVVLKEGKITEVGTYDELMQNGEEFARLIEEHVKESESAKKEKEEEKEKKPEKVEKKEEKPKEKESKLIAKEARDVGGVKWKVYRNYILAFGGFLLTGTVVTFYVLDAASSMGSNYWLSYWADSEDLVGGPPYSSQFYLGIYAAIGFGNCLFVGIRAFTLAIGGVNAAKVTHEQMITRVMRAPMSFFDTTPIGRILNRFSKDQWTVDEMLPRVMAMSLATCLQVLSVIIIIGTVTPFFLVSLVPLSFLYLYIQRYYLRSSRELKRLDSISKSPVYALFSETLNGLSTIRAYHKTDNFVELNEHKVDRNTQAYYLWIVANRWLGLRLEFIGACVVFGAAFFAVVERGDLDPGQAGLSITYALQLTGSLNWLVRMTTEVENNLIASERCMEYAELDVEPEPINPNNRPADDWPSQGAVSFQNLSIRYREKLPLVLKGVTADIKPEEKIGVCGRTGAGKSSLMLALFRLVDPASGTVVIDGMDICRLGLDDLRSRLAIIPQDPTLFTGTIRTNMDPFQQHTDAELWASIKAVHLFDQIDAMEDKLSSSVSEYGENLSVGTRQLLCLARALLRKAKVLVMDEATASVDFETDALIQKTIREEFANVTVLTIAHRINTILDYDRIMVLDQGELKEFDTPENLLKDPNGLFYSLVRRSGDSTENEPLIDIDITDDA